MVEESGDVGATPEVAQAALRSLIREEISQGLGELKAGVQESLRNVLREELSTGTKLVWGDNQPEGEAIKSMQTPLSNGVSSSLGDSLRHAASGSVSGSVNIPGSVPPGPTLDSQGTPKNQPAITASPLSGAFAPQFVPPAPAPAGVILENEVCKECGNAFMDDAEFCRRCGEKRPDAPPTVCECGNVFADDAQYCRKCGKGRPGVIEVTRQNSVSAQADPKKKKKKKNNPNANAYLFKQKTEMEHELTFLQKLTQHKSYEFCSGSLIIVNSIFLGWQTQFLAELFRDRAARGEAIGDPPVVFSVFQCLFAFFFSVELGLRWKAEGFLDFFRTTEVRWNILDVIVVGGSVLELFLDFVAFVAGIDKSDALRNVSVLRVLRVVRVVRVARIIRVMRFFRELRMMIYSILGCVKNLMWVIVVLAMTFYVFGVGFTSAVTDYMVTNSAGIAGWEMEEHEELLDYFGTVDKSVLHLFMSMSGGNDWSQYYFAMDLLPIWYRMGYLLFILFCLFAVVNIVTGVFVESALQSNIKDRDIIVHEELQAKKNYLQSMESIFEEMDENQQGTITLAEFEDKLKDERVIAYFNVLKLDVSDARILFALLDYDKSDEIGIDEFLDGCYKLQGESRSLDMKIMQYEVKFLTERFTEFDSSLKVIANRIDSSLKSLKASSGSAKRSTGASQESELR